MNKLLEIEGVWIQVSSKTIEINGKGVVTQGDVTILKDFNHDINERQLQQTNHQWEELDLLSAQKKIKIKKSST